MHDNTLRDSFSGLTAFIAVAREKSFTRAAAKLGISQSAVSHSVRALEATLEVRLLARNFKSVSTTEAGERLLRTVAPQFEEIDAELWALSELRDSPSGTIRITASDHPIRTILAPQLRKFLPQYPDIKLELSVDNGLVDIAAAQYDAGVRLGESVARDMIAVRIGPDLRFTVVATKKYFSNRAIPLKPEDLMKHSCVNLRLPTYGGVWAWEFENRGRQTKAVASHTAGLVSANFVDCLVHLGDDVEAVEDVQGIRAMTRDHLEVGLPHVRAHELNLLAEWFSDHGD